MTDYSVPADTQAAIRALVEKHPILVPLFDEHVEDMGEILPHVVMPNFARLLGRLVAEQWEDPAVIGEVKAIIGTVDTQLREGSYEVKNVIAVSFLEMLPSTGEPGTEIRELLTPSLREVFDEVNW
jgi:hypothetical protein